MTAKTLIPAAVAACVGLLPAVDFPNAEIANGWIRAKIYLPDAQNGYYRGTRFDWSGVVYSLQYAGHNYYGPWVQRRDAKVRDFVYEGSDIVGGPCSSIAGPADEFGQVGWEEAKPGGGRRTTSSWNWPWKAGPISCLPSTPRTSRAPSASAFGWSRRENSLR